MKTEQNKLEQQFKQKLDKRLIQPSDAAWDRLDAMLSVAEKKQAKRPVKIWLFAAAACLAVLLGGTLFFRLQVNDNNALPQDTAPAVVASPDTITPIDNTTGKQENEVVITEPAITEKAVLVVTGKKTERVNQHKTVGVKKDAGQELNESVIADNTTTGDIKKNTITIDPQKLLASVESGNDEPIANAKKTYIKVDANSLLSTVEGEMDESFRDKAFKTAIKNFNALKTSVANRNYQ